MGFLDNLKRSFSGRVDLRKRYEFLREAVSGTMSDFYMARDRETDRIVGLKILDPEKYAFFEARFAGLKKPSEGEIGQSLDHPNIVKTLEYGVSNEGRHYIVMEFLDGPGLNSLIIARYPHLVGRRLPLLLQAAEALRFVHAAGYIHRDICPRNFVVSKNGETLKLIDFGLTVPAKPEFMQPGNRTGTPSYMAPEIVRRRRTDQRLDIFSFGVTAFELLTFELPWPRGSSDGKAALSHDTESPRDIRELYPQIHPQLASTVMKCLAVDPAGRPQTMDQVLSMLSTVKSESVAPASGAAAGRDSA